MMEFLKTYKVRPWPKLEVPPMRQSHLLALVIFTAGLIAAGWYIWFAGVIHAEYFIALGLVIPLAFLLKSRFVALIGLLCFEVILAFIFVGNLEYALYPVIGLVAAIITFESPIIMYVLLIGAVWYGMTPFASPHPLQIELTMCGAVLLGWMFQDILKEKVKRAALYFPEKWPALLFLAWVSAAFAIWCIEPFPLGWLQLKWFIVGITFFIVSPLIIRSEKELNIVIGSWIAVGMIAVASVIVGPAIGYEPEAKGWGAAPGALGVQKNMSAVFLSFTFFISLACLFWVRGFYRKALISTCVIALFGATLYQQSKSAAAGMALGVVLFWIIDSFLRPEKSVPIKIIGRLFLLLCGVLLLLFSVYLLGLGEIMGGYGDLFYNPTTTSTMQARLVLWGAAYEMITTENHPIRGLGPAAFWLLGPEYGVGAGVGVEDDPEILYLQGINPHNLYIDLFLHYGVPGTFLYLWLSISVMVRLWKGFLRFKTLKFRYLCLALFCGLISFHFHCFMDFTVFMINGYWLYIGLAVATISVGRNLQGDNLQTTRTTLQQV